jgi:hypothetical protein
MIRSDRGMVSQSSVRVIRRKRDLLPNLRLHQFHRPSDGTSGELGFMRPLKWSPSAGQESGSAKRDSLPIGYPRPVPGALTYISTFSSESESPFFLPLLLK